MEDTWQNAVNAVQKKELSLGMAAEKFGVSKTSLHRRVSGQVPISVKKGPCPFLSKMQEKAVVDMCEFKAQHGMCMTQHDVRTLAREIALQGKTAQNIPKKFPSTKWVQRFIKRQPTLSTRKAQVLDVKRAEASTIDNVQTYYKNLAKIIVDFPPERIFNCDETGVTVQGKASVRVVCPKVLLR